MKLPILLIAVQFCATALQARETVPSQKAATLYNAAATQPQFIENKGQITDQYGAPRRDIDYKLSGGDVTLFVGNGQLHYQWSHAVQNSKSESRNTKLSANRKSPSGPAAAGRDAGVVNIYRMDVVLLGADKNAVAVAEDMQPYYENYYLPAVPNGATAHSYRKITYKNVYPHIDWVLYTPKSPEGDFAGCIKYDFIVHPGGNVSDIQLQYDGATALALKDGALEAATPMGSITEAAPYCYTAGSKAAVASSYVLEGNVLRYDVSATAANSTLIIDPALRWATYYRDFVSGVPLAGGVVASDTAGNVYHAGATQATANVAISGGHQTTIGGGADYFVVKFNGNGVPQWATYYGGTGTEGDQGGGGGDEYDIATEPDGTVYLVGTTSSSGLATTGSFQSVKSGATYDALLVKFNASGVRQWATYYGGSATGGSGFYSVCYDATSNHIYVGGGTDATTNIATTGTYMSTKPGSSGAGMLVKFTTSGGRVWGSYYPDNISSLTTDIYGNCYVGVYQAFATTGVGTSGTYQPSMLGGTGINSSIGKFNAGGGYVWGTYYSSSSCQIRLYDLKADNKGTAVYAAISTNCSTGVTTTGVHQSSFGGPTNGDDALLTKFNSTNGTRIWSTYNGGAGQDGAYGITVLPDDNIVMLGPTTSSNNIAGTGAMQSSLGAQFNTFFAIFTPDGMRPYGTYYGLGNCGIGALGNCVSNGKGRIAASLRGSVSYTTSGAYRTTPGDSYIMQMEADTSVYIRQPFADTVVCSGDTLSIPYGVVQNFRTTNNFIFELSNASGSFASGVTTMGTVAAQTGGVYNYVVPHSTTQSNLYRVRVRSTAPLDTAYEEVNIRITTLPQSPTATNNGPVCSGTSLNLASSSTTAGVSYSWSGPSGYTSTAQNPVRNPGYTKYSGDYIVTISNNGCISKDTTTAAVDSTPIAITAGNNGPLCVGSDLQLTATNTSAGATYNWSGPSFSNTTQNPTINNVGLANAGVYSVYASLGNCNSATVTTTVSVVNGPSVNIYPSPNDSICGNITGSATFVATAVNPGGSPSYQWYKNGTLVATTTGNTYAATGIQTGDVFYTKLVPGTGAACNTPVNSNQINMTVMPYLTPSVSISVSPDSTTWSGVMLTFTATVTNAGNNPKYQWKVNGVSMAGATSSTWGATTLNDNDKVSCEVTSSYICPQPQKVTSNVITLKVKTGINRVEANNISIYPNPTQTTLTVEGVTKGTIIQLKDVLGRQMIYTTATQTKTVLNTSQLTAGNYLLVLTTTTCEVLTEKVVKE